MKRFVLLFVLLAFALSTPAEAQTPSWQHQVYFNAGPQFPTATTADNFKTGLALDVGYYYRAGRAFFIGLAGGYHQFKGERAGVGDVNVIPLHLAFKYNFSLTGVQPYIGAEGGPSFFRNGDDETRIGLAPRFGFRIPLARGIDFDVNVKYNVFFDDPDNFTYVGANGGFAYILDR